MLPGFFILLQHNLLYLSHIIKSVGSFGEQEFFQVQMLEVVSVSIVPKLGIIILQLLDLVRVFLWLILLIYSGAKYRYFFVKKT